jgi:hypothetical protein
MGKSMPDAIHPGYVRRSTDYNKENHTTVQEYHSREGTVNNINPAKNLGLNIYKRYITDVSISYETLMNKYCDNFIVLKCSHIPM